MTLFDFITCAGVSFEDLCKMTEIPASTLSDIISGKAELSHCQARTIQKLAHGMGFTMDELMDISDDIKKIPLTDFLQIKAKFEDQISSKAERKAVLSAENNSYQQLDEFVRAITGGACGLRPVF